MSSSSASSAASADSRLSYESLSNFDYPNFTSPIEFTHVISDDRIVTLLNRVFDNDLVGSAYLRHFAYITTNIHRIRYELDQHEQERDEIFNHMMRDGPFRDTVRPVVNTYRRRTRRSGLHPYTRLPLNNGPLSRGPSPFPSNSSTTAPSQPSLSGVSTTSYYSVQESQPGTSANPIDVDAAVDDDDEAKTVKKPYTRATRQFLRPEPPCKRCGQVGHKKPDCDTPMRSSTHCYPCEWKRQSQDQCNHYDISPAELKKLRHKVPYLEPTDSD